MKIGFLPLYIKLYDDIDLSYRVRMEKFYSRAADAFRKEGLEVIENGFCRLENEFISAVKKFEDENADVIVTLHMAYSPSLESIDALCGTSLPIVVLDCTETETFGPCQNPDEIMYCHGIHGVMDMCSMLTRRGKPYAIAAGLFGEDVIKEACGYVRAAVAAKSLCGLKTGLIGGLFDGMGDFRVPYEEMKSRFGIEVADIEKDDIVRAKNSVTKEELDAEMKYNEENFDFGGEIIEDEYRKNVLSCLAVRKLIKDKGLDAFSVNFTRMGEESGLDSMPFIETCREMENGIGYAGEGDVLTASFVGAFIKAYPETNFVEIFCPDWKNNILFLSHMGEVNYKAAGTKPVIRRADSNFTPAEYPYVGYTRMKGGKGVFVNISRGKDDYALTAAEGEMLDTDRDCFEGSMRGWLRLPTDTASFLKQYSEAGATHHSVFIYGAGTSEIEYFGRLLGLKITVIK